MGAEGFLGKPCFKNIEILLSRLRFIPCSKTILASGMKSPNDGDRDNDQHQYHVDAKAPQQNAGSGERCCRPKCVRRLAATTWSASSNDKTARGSFSVICPDPARSRQLRRCSQRLWHSLNSTPAPRCAIRVFKRIAALQYLAAQPLREYRRHAKAEPGDKSRRIVTVTPATFAQKPFTCSPITSRSFTSSSRKASAGGMASTAITFTVNTTNSSGKSRNQHHCGRGACRAQ